MASATSIFSVHSGRYSHVYGSRLRSRPKRRNRRAPIHKRLEFQGITMQSRPHFNGNEWAIRSINSPKVNPRGLCVPTLSLHRRSYTSDASCFQRVRMFGLFGGRDRLFFRVQPGALVTINCRGRAPRELTLPARASTAASRRTSYYGQENAGRRHTPGGNSGCGAGWNSPRRI